jgi:serine/threonine-protein kinase RsbW
MLRRQDFVPDLLLRGNQSMRDAAADGPHEIVISSDPAEARRVQDAIETALLSRAYEEREVFSIKLALEEALVNAIKHGNQMDRSKKVNIRYHIQSDRFDIVIVDEGRGFDPADVPDPMAAENLERPCGRGLLLMRHYMTEVNFDPPGNRLTMSMIRKAKPSCNGVAHP